MTARTVLVLPLLALLGLVGCAAAYDDPPPLPTEEDVGDGVDGDGDGAEEAALATSDPAAPSLDLEATDAPADPDELEGDLLPAPMSELPATPTTLSAARPPKVIYLNFAGPIIRTCAAYCNDATKNVSTLIKSTFGKSAVDFLPYTSSTGRSKILSLVRQYFARYDVVVTTKRPASGPYTMAVVSPSRVGPTDRRGTSYLDCSDATKTDIAFVYRIGASTPARIARYVTHELGHTVGLMHVTSTTDLMQYASSGSRWTTATLDVARNPPGYTCIPGKTRQDEPAILASVLGLRP